MIPESNQPTQPTYSSISLTVVLGGDMLSLLRISLSLKVCGEERRGSSAHERLNALGWLLD